MVAFYNILPRHGRWWGGAELRRSMAYQQELTEEALIVDGDTNACQPSGVATIMPSGLTTYVAHDNLNQVMLLRMRGCV